MPRSPVLALALLAVFATASASPSNKWRIQISSDADSDGTVVFEVTPTGQAPVAVTVQLAKDTSENGVARRIRDAMRQQLGKGYKVEVDDGEDVLLKNRHGTPAFDLVIKEQAVEGLRITLDKE